MSGGESSTSSLNFYLLIKGKIDIKQTTGDLIAGLVVLLKSTYLKSPSLKSVFQRSIFDEKKFVFG